MASDYVGLGAFHTLTPPSPLEGRGAKSESVTPTAFYGHVVRVFLRAFARGRIGKIEIYCYVMRIWTNPDGRKPRLLSLGMVLGLITGMRTRWWAEEGIVAMSRPSWWSWGTYVAHLLKVSAPARRRCR